MYPSNVETQATCNSDNLTIGHWWSFAHPIHAFFFFCMCVCGCENPLKFFLQTIACILFAPGTVTVLLLATFTLCVNCFTSKITPLHNSITQICQ